MDMFPNLLNSEEEPTDEQLRMLFYGIGAEAKAKAKIIKQQMQERIQQEIKEAWAQYKAKYPEM